MAAKKSSKVRTLPRKAIDPKKAANVRGGAKKGFGHPKPKPYLPI